MECPFLEKKSSSGKDGINSLNVKILLNAYTINIHLPNAYTTNIHLLNAYTINIQQELIIYKQIRHKQICIPHLTYL